MYKSLSYWHIHEGHPLKDTDFQKMLLLASLWGIQCDTVTIATAVSMISGLSQLKARHKATDANTMNIVLQYLQTADPQMSEHLMKLKQDTSNLSPAHQIIRPLHERFFIG